MSVSVSRIESPIGQLTLVHCGECLLALEFSDRPERLSLRLERGLAEGMRENGHPPGRLLRSLESYFAGRLGALDRVSVDPGGTAFQRQVWDTLRSIPVGSTLSYAELARRIGRPRAIRAVAAANATNPVAVVIPCHRVIASDGSLKGYGGGLDRKRWLLSHEGALVEA